MKVFYNIGIENNITERLLAYRESIGDDTEKNEYYHRLVIRYQKFIARSFFQTHNMDQSDQYIESN